MQSNLAEKMPRDRNYFDRKDTLHGKLPEVFHTKTEGQRNSQVERGYEDTTEAQSNTDRSRVTQTEARRQFPLQHCYIPNNHGITMLLPAMDLRDPKKDIFFPSSQDELFVNRNVNYFKRCAVRTDLSYTEDF